MIEIKILGSGCVNCKQLEAILVKLVDENKIDARIEKVTDFEEIVKYPILGTPGLVINEKLVSAGRIPTMSELLTLLNSA